MEERGVLHVGVDWAAESHQVCVLDDVGESCLEMEYPHSGHVVAQLCRDLGEMASYGEAAVRAG